MKRQCKTPIVLNDNSYQVVTAKKMKRGYKERGCAMGLQEGKRNQIQSFRDKILSFQLPDFLGGALRRGGKGAPSLQDQLQPWDLFATLRAPGTKMAPARRRNPGGKY